MLTVQSVKFSVGCPMKPLAHWIFLFGTLIAYLVAGILVFLFYGPSGKQAGGDR